MPSLISWLDAGAEETSRMRELVKLFEMPESVDDLALGQFRDSISNAMFPGTSVLHVAARYLVLVPWCFQTAGNARSGEKVRATGEQAERRLIRRLQEVGAARFIGSSAGDCVAQLPSAVYWSALRAWGIVRGDVERSGIGEAMADETDLRAQGFPTEPVWHAGLPPVPVGFPGTDEHGIEPNRVEAEWLRDRILATIGESLLAQMAANPRHLLKTSEAPWVDPCAKCATGEAAIWLAHAEAYSALQRGLDSTYYDLVTAQAHTKYGNAEDEPDRDFVDEWHTGEDYPELLRRWDLDDFIVRAKKANPRIQPHSIDFLRRAVKELASNHNPGDNEVLQRMVRDREKRAKGANSRFTNERRLRSWKAPDRINQQTFRWQQVRTMMVDLREGLARA
ncbi:DUF6361 family protein [Arthrobacter rhombi]|uniref:DUF6361 family protein n=1 Tax=Arthrobacter rhombi TaxID=71253 RepID=UPI003FD54C50